MSIVTNLPVELPGRTMADKETEETVTAESPLVLSTSTVMFLVKTLALLLSPSIH